MCGTNFSFLPSRRTVWMACWPQLSVTLTWHLWSPLGFDVGAKYVLFCIPVSSDNRSCELWPQQQMFLIFHETNAVCFLPGGCGGKAEARAAAATILRPQLTSMQVIPGRGLHSGSLQVILKTNLHCFLSPELSSSSFH